MEDMIINQFKTKFLTLREEMLNEWVDIELGLSKGDDIDICAEESERSMVLKLMGRQSFFLKRIDDSLKKIDEGCFGICEECSGEIGLTRLQARPTAKLCIKCKEEQEKIEGHVPYHRRSHTLGQSINISSSEGQQNIRTISAISLPEAVNF